MALKFWREMYLAGKMLRISCVSVYHLSAHPVKASFILPRNNYLFLSNSKYFIRHNIIMNVSTISKSKSKLIITMIIQYNVFANRLEYLKNKNKSRLATFSNFSIA